MGYELTILAIIATSNTIASSNEIRWYSQNLKSDIYSNKYSVVMLLKNNIELDIVQIMQLFESLQDVDKLIETRSKVLLRLSEIEEDLMQLGVCCGHEIDLSYDPEIAILQNQVALCDIEEAINEGGETRNFFDICFTFLDSLIVPVSSIKVCLNAETSRFFHITKSLTIYAILKSKYMDRLESSLKGFCLGNTKISASSNGVYVVSQIFMPDSLVTTYHLGDFMVSEPSVCKFVSRILFNNTASILMSMNEDVLRDTLSCTDKKVRFKMVGCIRHHVFGILKTQYGSEIVRKMTTVLDVSKIDIIEVVYDLVEYMAESGGLEAYFILFSNIHAIIDFRNDLRSDLLTLKEDVFCSIIKNSGIHNIEFTYDEIVCINNRFIELYNQFMQSNCPILYSYFLDCLCSAFLSRFVKRKLISLDQVQGGKYIFDLCQNHTGLTYFSKFSFLICSLTKMDPVRHDLSDDELAEIQSIKVNHL